MEKRKVSVVITSYNRGRLLKRAVDSVLNQTYKNIEVIIVDDNSKCPETCLILNELKDSSERVKVLINSSNKGGNYCRNRGIKNSKGFFYTGLDDDDYFLPKRIEMLVSSYKDEFAFVCDNYLVYKSGKLKGRFNYSKLLKPKHLAFENLAGNQVLTTVDKITEAGLFDETLKRLQDQDMWFRLLLRFGKALRINKKTYIMDVSSEESRVTTSIKDFDAYNVFYKKHSSNMGGLQVKKNKLRLKYLRNENLGFIGMLICPKFFIKSSLRK